jgi:Mor family transcriptional regulator
MKQFMLSLLATTISIALTLGTSAIIENNKKQKEKREIVMMVMYDMYNSLALVEKADSQICRLIDRQEQIAADTTKYNFDKKLQMYVLLPQLEYTETTERIFSSNIETINTVGNVLFTENVAKFYQTRHIFKTQVCDSLSNEARNQKVFNSAKAALDFSLFEYAVLSRGLLYDMQHLFAQCKQMMNVTAEELQAYRKERNKWEQDFADRDSVLNTFTNKQVERYQRMRELLE